MDALLHEGPQGFVDHAVACDACLARELWGHQPQVEVTAIARAGMARMRGAVIGQVKRLRCEHRQALADAFGQAAAHAGSFGSTAGSGSTAMWR